MVPSALAMMALALSGMSLRPIDLECGHSLDAVLRADRHRAVLAAFDRVDLKVALLAVGLVAHSLHRNLGAQALHVFLDPWLCFAPANDQHVDGASADPAPEYTHCCPVCKAAVTLTFAIGTDRSAWIWDFGSCLHVAFEPAAGDDCRRRTAAKSWDPTECRQDRNSDDEASTS